MFIVASHCLIKAQKIYLLNSPTLGYEIEFFINTFSIFLVN
jgi:hypothetical protein